MKQTNVVLTSASSRASSASTSAPGSVTPGITAAGSVGAASDNGWTILSRVGAILLVIGLADLVLTFYPSQFGEPTWEFASVDAAFSSLPVFTIGVGMVLAAALARGHRAQVRVISVTCIALSLMIVGLYALYMTNVPLALQLSPPEVLPGIKKSIGRTSLMAVVFPFGLVTAAVTALRRNRA